MVPFFSVNATLLETDAMPLIYPDWPLKYGEIAAAHQSVRKMEKACSRSSLPVRCKSPNFNASTIGW